MKVVKDAVTSSDVGSEGYLSRVAFTVVADDKPSNPSVKGPAISALQADPSNPIEVDSTLAS